MRILDSSQVEAALSGYAVQMEAVEEQVAEILRRVRRGGDRAVLDYARRFDGFEGEQLWVPTGGALDPELEHAIETAAANIRRFAERQLPQPFELEVMPGVRVGQLVRPLDCVAAYIPSGRYPLPSTLLMTVIPAQVAGVGTICAATPRISPVLSAVAGWLGLPKILAVGGAHAVAAFAYGTESIPRADRIVGPGSAWVTAAKKLVAGETGIDFLAGPSEVVVVSEHGRPDWIAADLLAQAEHDPAARAILITPNRALAEAVAREVETQLAGLPTAEIARQSIAGSSFIWVTETASEALDGVNRIAPEHLMLEQEWMVEHVRHAGSIFVGEWSPESAGDYASGTNHVLPTSGVARVRGGLSAADYVKCISVQQLTQPGLAALEPSISALARAEGLEAHARAAEIRKVAP